MPEYWGDPPYELNEHEQKQTRMFFNTAKIAAEFVRETFPHKKISFPGATPVRLPLLRADFPKHLIDGSGIDIPGFERLPEQQLHQISIHRLWQTRQVFKNAGIDKPYLPYVEGIFVPTEPGASTWDEQANYYHRWSLISMAYGVTDFYSGWFAFDCGSYYGAEHYGGCGIQRRIPYGDPKPAYAHYATMTRMLSRATFDKWLPTGSHSTYCLRFNRSQGGPAYALWTLRGSRPVTLHVGDARSVTVTDSMDNPIEHKPVDGKVTVATNGSPVYVTGIDSISSIELGAPDHSDAVEWSRTRNRDTWGTGPVVSEAGDQPRTDDRQSRRRQLGAASRSRRDLRDQQLRHEALPRQL